MRINKVQKINVATAITITKKFFFGDVTKHLTEVFNLHEYANFFFY